MATGTRRRGSTRTGSGGSASAENSRVYRWTLNWWRVWESSASCESQKNRQTRQELRSPSYAQPRRQWQSSQEVGQTSFLPRLSLKQAWQRREDIDMQAGSSASEPWMSIKWRSISSRAGHPWRVESHRWNRPKAVSYPWLWPRHIGQSDTWFMDGYYAMSPGVFEQLYVVRAHLRGSALSCVYGFLSGIYQELLQAVLDKMETMQICPDPALSSLTLN